MTVATGDGAGDRAGVRGFELLGGGRVALFKGDWTAKLLVRATAGAIIEGVRSGVGMGGKLPADWQKF